MSKSTAKTFDPSKYVTKKLNADTICKLKEVFDVFDYDGSGNITTEELLNTIKALNLESQAQQIISIVSNSGNQGELDFAAFLSIFGFDDSAPTQGGLQTIFEAFDLSGSGAFGVDEFLKVAQSVGDSISLAEAEQTIQYADKDGDGLISYEEFVTVMTTVYPKV